MRHLNYMMILLLCAEAVTMTACKKNDASTGTATVTTVPAITDGTWKRQSFAMYDDPLDTWIGDPVSNALPPMTLAFTTDGKFTETYNGAFSGAWALSSDKATLTITGGSAIAGTYAMFLSSDSMSGISILYFTYPLAGTRYTKERIEFLHP